ncbi:MAG: RluA family pseudouridine synthase [Holosporaceae bacterium]|jgi:23S rRNA pseudouridine955/2504/2580 synthase|nr:RluA family pseudouridine synthase [Holosporaceae bacterium]
MYEHTVTEDEDGLRADRIARSILSRAGYVFLQKQFRIRRIKLNGKRVAPSTKLQKGDILQIFANLEEETKESTDVFEQKLFNSLKSMIIYEDENFLALNKPTKLAVQLGSKIFICVETFIKSYPDCRCRLVHRLDRDASGVLLIAKNRKYAGKLTKLFRENRIRKTYLAVVCGQIHRPGKIDNFLKKSFISNEEKMVIAEEGQRAVTLYNPVRLMGDYTLLELNPLTGRKHQLRVHCADVLKTPILGDKKYSRDPELKHLSRHLELFLHAHKIFLEDLSIEITAEIPQHFCDLLI